MSEDRKLGPAEVSRAIEDEARLDALDEALDAIDAMSPEQIAAELRAAGVDPDEAGRRVRASVEAALARGGPAVHVASPAPPVVPDVHLAPVVPLASRRRAPWGMLGGFAAAAAAVVLLVVGVRQMSGDQPAHPPPGRPTPSAQRRSLELRTAALKACDANDLAACQRGLDEAADADSESERDPAVVEARKKLGPRTAPSGGGGP